MGRPKLDFHTDDFYHPDRDIVSHLYIPNRSPLRPVFWTQDWNVRARVQFWTMLRINYLLGLHDLLDYWVNATLLDTRDATIYGLGTRRRSRSRSLASKRSSRVARVVVTFAVRR